MAALPRSAASAPESSPQRELEKEHAEGVDVVAQRVFPAWLALQARRDVVDFLEGGRLRVRCGRRVGAAEVEAR